MQPQASVSSIPTGSPGPKRSGTTGNTLKKWLTSPVRRLSHGKGDNANAKKPTGKQRKRDGRKSVDLGPQHEDSTEEVLTRDTIEDRSGNSLGGGADTVGRVGQLTDGQAGNFQAYRLGIEVAFERQSKSAHCISIAAHSNVLIAMLGRNYCN